MSSQLSNPPAPVSQSQDAGDQPVRNAPPARRPLWQRLLLLLVVVGAVAAFGVWLVGRLRPPELHSTVLQAPELPADFVLTGSDGNPVHLSDLQGKWTALYFGYSFCPDVCPTTLADLNVMMQALGNRADDAQVAFVSLDPERDTPQRMADYLAYFNPAFIGLTGDAQAVDQAATQFGVYYEQRDVGGASGYLIDHTSTVIVLDPEGRMRLVFPYGVKGEDMASDLLYFMRRG
jgi:protein SCO1/2